MSSGPNTVVYLNNLDTQNPTSEQLQQLQSYASDLSTSDFTTGILWALHVNASGDFIYNNGDPMISGGQLQSCLSDLPGLLSTIKGGTVNKLLFSIGGWTCESDFVNIGNLINQYGTGSTNPLYQNFQALAEQLYIDGIDLDLEADSSPPPYSHDYSYYTNTVVQLTEMLNSLGLEVTYCPYTASDFWLNCMAQVYQKNQQQLVNWWNLQCYAGGSGNTQAEWVGYIQNYSSPLGVSDPAAFVIPGYGTPPDCPNTIESYFSNSEIMDAGINGGFIWNYGGIVEDQSSSACAPNNSTKDFADAIINGIAKLSSGKQAKAG